MKVLKTAPYGFAALAAALLLITVTAPIRAEVTENVMEPFSLGVTIPCTGDFVILEGYMHVLYTWTEDANGGLHMKMHFQPAQLKGIVVLGPNEGARYNGVGVTQSIENLKKGETYTFVNVYDMIGQGKAPNFKVHTVIKVTVNANGEVTVDFEKERETCK